MVMFLWMFYLQGIEFYIVNYIYILDIVKLSKVCYLDLI